MILTPDDLERKWGNVTYYNGGFIRVAAEHPLEWYVGYQAIDQKTLMIVSNSETIAPDSSKSVLVSSRRREVDEKWTLTFELMKNEQEGVFINLCCDILNYSQSAASEKEALNRALTRYKQWSRLLEYQKPALMDEGTQKGLFGELLFLQSKVKEGIKVLSVVQAWVGPDGSDQDFVFADGWYEVKTIGVAADSVSISSLQQLDCDGSGHLVIIRVDKSAPERQGAFSLFQKVEQIREVIKQDQEAATIFEVKLARYGYIDLPEYEIQAYYYSGEKSYTVNESFPKLSSKNVPSQVIASQYKLSIAGIENWGI